MQATKGAEVMTDNQWDAVVLAMIAIAKRCTNKDEVVAELKKLLIKKHEDLDDKA